MVKEIPHDEWTRFLQEFSRKHHGWLVQIEQPGAEVGGHTNIQSLPLEGMNIQLDGHDETLAIIARSSERAHGHLLYSVASPVGIKLEQSGRHGKRGRDKKLHIESSDAPTTIVAFRAAPPVNNAV